MLTEQVLKDAKDVWNKLKKLDVKIKPEDYEKEILIVYQKLEEEFKDFFGSFPIVAKCMVYSKQYDDSVMKEFITWYYESKKTRPKDYKEYLERQTEYTFFYLRYVLPRVSVRNGQRKMRNTDYENIARKKQKELLEPLIKEYEKMITMYDALQEKLGVEEIENKKQRLKDYLIKAKNTLDTDQLLNNNKNIENSLYIKEEL